MTQTRSDSLDSLFDAVRRLGVRRSHDSRMLAGVARGIAERYDIDPVLVRVAFVLLGIFFGLGVTLYLLAWLLLPAHDDRIAFERAVRDQDAGAIVLTIVTAISVVSPVSSGRDGWAHTVAVTVALGFIVWFVVRRGGDRPTGAMSGPAPSGGGAVPASVGEASTATGTSMPTIAAPSYGSPTRGGSSLAFDPASGQWVQSPPGAPTAAGGPAPTVGTASRPQRRPRLRRRPAGALANLLTLGLVAAATAGTYLWSVTTRPDLPPITLAAAAGLAAAALMLFVLGFAGRRAWLPALCAVVLAFPAVPIDTSSVGDHTWSPTRAVDVGNYSVIGEGRLDLSAVPKDDLAGRVVTVDLRAGDMDVVLPRDTTTKVEANLYAASLDVRGTDGRTTRTDGFQRTQLVLGSGTPTFTLITTVGAGTLTIDQGPTR